MYICKKKMKRTNLKVIKAIINNDKEKNKLKRIRLYDLIGVDDMNKFEIYPAATIIPNTYRKKNRYD